MHVCHRVDALQSTLCVTFVLYLAPVRLEADIAALKAALASAVIKLHNVNLQSKEATCAGAVGGKHRCVGFRV